LLATQGNCRVGQKRGHYIWLHIFTMPDPICMNFWYITTSFCSEHICKLYFDQIYNRMWRRLATVNNPTKRFFTNARQLHSIVYSLCRFLLNIYVVITFIGRSFAKRLALSYRTLVCSVCFVCLSVMLVYCGKTVGWIKMQLGMVAGLVPSHIVSDGDPAPPKGVQPPTFSPCLLWPNG